MPQKTIPITCEGAGLIDFSSLEPFQDNLKDLHKTEFEKLRQSIIKYGISAPFFVWGNKCLDGHQRIRVISEMLKEGYILKDGKVPFVEIEAKNKKEAKEKILLFASVYGRVTPESLYEFMSLESISIDDIKIDVELPEIDFEKFETEFFDRENVRTEESDYYTLMFKFQKDDAAYVQELLHRNREQHNEQIDQQWRERCLLRLLKNMD
jgi:hypothetical protein